MFRKFEKIAILLIVQYTFGTTDPWAIVQGLKLHISAKGFLSDFRETRLTPQTVEREFDLLKSFAGYEDTCCLESIEWVLGKDSL